MTWLKAKAKSDQVLDLRRASAQPGKRGDRWRRLRQVAGLLGLVIVVAGVAVGGWLWWHGTHSPNLNNVAVVEQLVGRHYVLPTGEQPTLATVTDKTKLQTPFLKQADNGDKLLVYEKAAVAIIYRPSIDRIVAVGPVQVQPLKTTPGAGQ